MPPHDSDARQVKRVAQYLGLTDDIGRPLLACLLGDMPANIALMQLCMAAPNATDVERAIYQAEQVWGDDIEPLMELRALWSAMPGAFHLVQQILHTVDHETGAVTSDAKLAACAAAFDRAVTQSPEASVALYSLGSPALLAEATAEIVQRMREWGLLGGDKTALEIGCGIGRFLHALAPEIGHITGIDIAAAMIAAARETCGHLANVEVRQTNGRDLAFLPDAGMDLILAADSFPYIVRCGAELVSKHFAEAARVLRLGGHLLILNFSYRGDLDQDRAAILTLAANTGFSVIREGTHDYRLWDGVSFLLGKESA